MTQAINLANFSNSLDTSGQVSPTVLNAPVPISKGGTGATTSAGAAAALIASIGNLLLPVGSIYTNSSNATNPASLLGFGTWAAFGQGRVMVGAGAGGGSTYTAGGTGGNKDSTGLPYHSHGANFYGNALAAHAHTFVADTGGAPGRPNGLYTGSETFGQVATGTTSSVSGGTPSGTVAVDAAATSVTDTNLQPYIVVYMWQRTA